MAPNNFLHKAKKSLPYVLGRKRPIPKIGRVQLGDLRRVKPLSDCFGYDRGGPVDRYYIENFLANMAKDIQGRVLEIGENTYTVKYGGQQVKQSDILHVDSSNPSATFVGDLAAAEHIPSGAFDCVVLTQTLHLIYDVKAALATCYRILKPGGVLLATVPGISHIDHGEWENIWMWSFTKRSMQLLVEETFPASQIQVSSQGNVLVASAFLYGLGVGELTKQEIETNDTHYQVIITLRAQKNSI